MHAIAEPCPTCGGFAIKPSRLRLEDFPCLVRLLRPLRCHSCGDRFYTRFFGRRTAHAELSKELVLRIRFKNPSRIVRTLALWISDRSVQSD
jgi:hypothetical protein